MSTTEVCTGCEKGLLYVAKKVTNGNEVDMKKLKLCNKCRQALIKSVNEVFAK